MNLPAAQMIAPPQRSDAHVTQSCPAPHMVHRGGAAQANDAINRQPTKAEGDSHKATPAKKEQTDCRAAAGAHFDLQAGRGAPLAEEGLCTAGSSNFIHVQASIRRLICRELDVERSGSTRRAVPDDQC